jgi:uncharacterized membrane protein YqiK
MYFSCLKGKLRVSTDARTRTPQPQMVETLAETVGVSPGGDEAAAVSRAYEELMASTPEGAEMRARFEGVLMMLDNNVIATHVFPDLAAEEADRLAAKAKATARAASAKAKAEAEAKAAAEAATVEAAKAAAEAESVASAAEKARAALQPAKLADKLPAKLPGNPAAKKVVE